MKVVVSSSNKDKIAEIKAILEDNYEVVTKADMGYGDFDVEEDGTTLEENAYKKARALYDLIKEPIFADDTGLFVEALGGRPGIYAARFAGQDCSYKDNVKKMLNELSDVTDIAKRNAYFETVICFIDKEGKEHFVHGRLKGRIAFKEQGDNGFGYDPIFMPEGYDKTFAQLLTSVKNNISHRALALAGFKTLLEDLG